MGQNVLSDLEQIWEYKTKDTQELSETSIIGKRKKILTSGPHIPDITMKWTLTSILQKAALY